MLFQRTFNINTNTCTYFPIWWIQEQVLILYTCTCSIYCPRFEQVAQQVPQINQADFIFLSISSIFPLNLSKTIYGSWPTTTSLADSYWCTSITMITQVFQFFNYERDYVWLVSCLFRTLIRTQILSQTKLRSEITDWSSFFDTLFGHIFTSPPSIC